MHSAIIAEAIANGACRAGSARIAPVPDGVMETYRTWLSRGHHASMAYLERYLDVRSNPAMLLYGARSILVCAYNYYPSIKRKPSLPHIAYYAYGQDYHNVLRQRLLPVVEKIETLFPDSECRICVDTAPLFERYWAVQAGIGFTGRHSQLIVPGTGSYVLLASIITTAELEPDEPCTLTCPDSCRRCIDACPGKAIDAGNHINAARCLSYLTIENREPFPDNTDIAGHLYGCDSCQAVCPYNSCAKPTEIDEFSPTETLLTITPGQIADMTADEFNAAFRHSAIKRAKLDGLRRNAAAIINKKTST